MTSIHDQSTPKVPLTPKKGLVDHERLVEIFKEIEAFSTKIQSVNGGKKVRRTNGTPPLTYLLPEEDTPPPLKNLSSTQGGSTTIITIADFKSLMEELLTPDSPVAPSFVLDQLVAVYGLLHRLYQECRLQDSTRNATAGPSPETSLLHLVNPQISDLEGAFVHSEQLIAVPPPQGGPSPGVRVYRGFTTTKNVSPMTSAGSRASLSLEVGPLSSTNSSNSSHPPLNPLPPTRTAGTGRGRRLTPGLVPMVMASSVSSVPGSSLTSVYEGVLNVTTSVKEAPAQHGTDEAGFDTINNYVIIQELGRGSFGKVMLACDQEGNQVAIKSMSCIAKAPKHRFAHAFSVARAMDASNRIVGPLFNPQVASGTSVSTSSEDTMVMREVAIMKKLRHKNIVQLKEVIHDEEEDQTHLVMDYICNGALAEVDASGVCTSNHITIGDLDAAKNCIHQAATGLEYLHRQGIVHRDVKPENLLVGADDDCYLADFGVSAVVSDNRVIDTSAGTQAFFSPELLRGDYEEATRFGEESDVWALGVTFYAILFGKVPFFAPNVVPLAASVLNDPIPFPSNLAEDDPLRSIFQGILHKDAQKRWTLKQLRHALRVGRPQLPERLRNDVNDVSSRNFGTDPSVSTAPYSTDPDEGQSFTDIEVTEEEVQAAILTAKVSFFKSARSAASTSPETAGAQTKHAGELSAVAEDHCAAQAETQRQHETALSGQSEKHSTEVAEM